MTTNYKTISSTGLVVGHACLLHSVTLTAGSANATLEIRDWNSATGGAIVDKVAALANSSNTIVFEEPIRIKTGIYLTIAGTGASASIKTDRETDFTTTSTSTSTTTTSTSTTTS